MRCVRIALYTYVLGVGLAGWAAVVGSVRGIIHDPAASSRGECHGDDQSEELRLGGDDEL
jgi:hypothetical protein